MDHMIVTPEDRNHRSFAVYDVAGSSRRAIFSRLQLPDLNDRHSAPRQPRLSPVAVARRAATCSAPPSADAAVDRCASSSMHRARQPVGTNFIVRRWVRPHRRAKGRMRHPVSRRGAEEEILRDTVNVEGCRRRSRAGAAASWCRRPTTGTSCSVQPTPPMPFGMPMSRISRVRARGHPLARVAGIVHDYRPQRAARRTSRSCRTGGQCR